MSRTTFSGPIRSLGGFYTQGGNSVVNIPDATNTITVNPEDHAGRLIRINDATLVITLPPIVVTSPGQDPNDPNTLVNLGTSYEFYLDITASNVKISTNGTDRFTGGLVMATAGGAANLYVPAGTNDNINLNGTTTGGIAGSRVKVTAVAALEWMVEGTLIGSGTLATPFADA
jgi:hypothetical protein